uniref:Uncharacterized protein n=1 Tax=Rhizophora mucronata TaxID=61149 RepID=A0A2P2NDZ3_RHIMU
MTQMDLDLSVSLDEAAELTEVLNFVVIQVFISSPTPPFCLITEDGIIRKLGGSGFVNIRVTSRMYCEYIII